jgi:hypothetical protein
MSGKYQRKYNRKPVYNGHSMIVGNKFMYMQRVPKLRLYVHLCMCNTKYQSSDSSYQKKRGGLIPNFGFWPSLFFRFGLCFFFKVIKILSFV